MQDGFFSKGIVIGIIILFIGAGVVPSISGELNQNILIEVEKKSYPNPGDELDQYQTEYDEDKFLPIGMGDEIPDPLHWTIAQSFIPTRDILTRVELLISRGGPTSNPYVLSIRDDLNGENLVEISVSPDNFLVYPEYSWIEFDFEDISVNAGETYYIVSYIAPKEDNAYAWYLKESDVYTNGMGYRKTTASPWEPMQWVDLCFKTYGTYEIPENGYEDQSQKIHYGGQIVYPDCYRIAQSFRPSLNVLTMVKLFLSKEADAIGDLIVSIKSSLTGPDLVSTIIPNEEIKVWSPQKIGEWETADFDDIIVDTSKKYYIAVRDTNNDNIGIFWFFGDFYHTDPYPPGNSWIRNECNEAWAKWYAGIDFTFITYGYKQGSSGNGNLIITGYCPIDMEVIDPNGRIINEKYSEISNAIYIEEELNGIGEIDDQIFIPNALDGEYHIKVISEPWANPSDNFSIVINYESGNYKLAENVLISDIPQESYVFKTVRPSKPSKPSGKTSGKTGIEYTYTTSSTEPDGGNLYYIWDWADETNYTELGPYNSGVTCSASHIWTYTGDYSVRVRSINEFTIASEWSEPLGITITKNRAIQTPFLNLLQSHPILFQLLQQLLNL